VLADKYHKLLDDNMKSLEEMCEPYTEDLERYKKQNPKVKLDIPINFGSPKQLQVLLYDIIGLDAGVDKVTKKPIRGTGEDILKTLDHPICNAILAYREFEKLVGTYIDKLPNCAEKDGRIHCEFDQYGADTGRFSSKNPNLQNLPSHNTDIRQMFRARTDEKLVTETDKSFVVDKFCEVPTLDGWKRASQIVVGDMLKISNNGVEEQLPVVSVFHNKDNIVFSV
jgi:DNA polymerase I-like protein with 3'-5' exonuclease and polymerase domains